MFNRVLNTHLKQVSATEFKNGKQSYSESWLFLKYYKFARKKAADVECLFSNITLLYSATLQNKNPTTNLFIVILRFCSDRLLCKIHTAAFETRFRRLTVYMFYCSFFARITLANLFIFCMWFDFIEILIIILVCSK